MPRPRCFDRGHTGNHLRPQRRQKTKVEIVVAERGMNLRRFDGCWCSNRVEQVCIEDCSLIEIFRVIRQTREGSLPQPLQFVRFQKRFSSIFHLLTDAGTLSLGRYWAIFTSLTPK